jgi:hypothetical protein
MSLFTIMSPKGWTGPSYEAGSPEEAERMAAEDGYEVIDYIVSEPCYGTILVVEDEG